MSTVSLRARIEVRAYFLALSTGFTIDPVTAWLEAEAVEVALAERAKARRSEAARKGAATRRANATARMLAAFPGLDHIVLAPALAH